MSLPKSRLDQLATDLWDHVFAMLDGEPELSADDAGVVAAAVEITFRARLMEVCDACGAEAPTSGGLCADCHRNREARRAALADVDTRDDVVGPDATCLVCKGAAFVFSDGRVLCTGCD